MMKCFQAKAHELAPQWYVIDATEVVVGRLAAQIAPILMGKHRPTYTPHIDTGDYVIVTNVEKVAFTGRKWEQVTLRPLQRLPRRLPRRGRLEAPGAAPRPDPPRGDPADDAQVEDGPPHDGEAQALRRAEPPAPGPAADPAGAEGRPADRLRGHLRPRALAAEAEGPHGRRPPSTRRRSPAPPSPRPSPPPSRRPPRPRPRPRRRPPKASRRPRPRRPPSPRRPRTRRPSDRRPAPRRSTLTSDDPTRPHGPRRPEGVAERTRDDAHGRQSLHLGHRPPQDGRRPRPHPRGQRPVPRQRPARRRVLQHRDRASRRPRPAAGRRHGRPDGRLRQRRRQRQERQSGAVVLGLGRALSVLPPGPRAAAPRPRLPDPRPRMVERKKYGHKKARRSFQFSKR